MIRLLTGDDSWAREQALIKLVAEFDAEPERFEGSQLERSNLPDLLMATTLFQEKRFIIIKNLSENSLLWQELPTWLERLADTVELVLVEEKPDKRTTTYKALQKAAEVQEFKAWTDRDTRLAEQWLAEQAKKAKVGLSAPQVRLVVERVGVDKWALQAALEKLALLEAVDEQAIKDLIDARPLINVFNLFDKALRGQTATVHQELETLRLAEDPYKLFALLSSQAMQLAAVSLAGPGDNPARDFKIAPFVIDRLRSAARNLTRHDIHCIIAAFADTDKDIKTSRGEPWLLIERSLLQVAALRAKIN